MPQKIKKPRERQYHRKLPHVEEEPEEEEDEGSLAFLAVTKASDGYGNKAEAAAAAEAEGAPAMEAGLRVERSPHPVRWALLTSAASRRCGPRTPVPRWKMYDNPFADAMASAAASTQYFTIRNLNSNPNPNSTEAAGASSRHSTVSARKLAATLWESQGFWGMVGYHKNKEGPSQLPRPRNGERKKPPLPSAPSPASTIVSQRSLRCASAHHKFQSGDTSRKNPAASTSRSTPVYSQVLRLLREHTGDGCKNNAEVEDVARSFSSSKHVLVNVKAVQTDVEAGPETSSDLLNVLNQIWSLEQQHSLSSSMVVSLDADLEKTRAQVQELTTEQSMYREEMERLNKKLDNEKARLQKQEQEAIVVALKPLKEELENERNFKHKLESQHKKLLKEISEAKKALVKALQDLEREQKARELMEDVCDELAREIGEDKAQVEELKRQSAKVREEVEEERKMLQMAEVWREERVQMKLAEARLELEEKNTALDKLRNELEAFLRAKRSLDEENHDKAGKVSSLDEVTSSTLHVTDLESLSVRYMSPVVPINALVKEKGFSLPIQELDEEGLFNDDLHSIELNKVPFSGSLNGNQWIYSIATHQEVAGNGRRSVDKGIPSANQISRGGNQGQGTIQGLERTRSSPVEALMAKGERSDMSGVQEFDLQWIARGVGRSAVKDGNGGRRLAGEPREVLHSPWQSDNEESQGPITIGTRSKGRSLHSHTDGFSRSGSKGQSTGATVTSWDLYVDGVASKHQASRSPRDGYADAVNPHKQQSATFQPSPIRQWGQFGPTPDLASPRRTSQALEALPRASRDNSLKAKLLEAKLEGQQTRLRNKGL